MAKRIFVSATSQDSGKTTISLSLLYQARKKYKRVGFIKPIGPKPIGFLGRRIDTDSATVAQVRGLEHLIDDMCPVVVEPGMTSPAISKITRQILDNSGIPWLRTSRRTDNVFLAIHENVSKLTPEEKEKIALMQQLSMKRFDFDTIDQLLSI